MKKFLVFWLPIILWMGVIFFFSHQPYLKSSFAPEYDLMLRKLAHVAEYLILSVLLIRAFIGSRFSFGNALAFALALVLLYAVSDEFHQSFIAGRQGTIKDILIDSIGIFIGIILYVKIALNKCKNYD